jgi:hypothetical protein
MANPPKQQRLDARADIPDEYKPAEWLIKQPYRPENSDTAVSHRDVLYAAVGRVLTAWEILETLLAGEFQRLVGTDRPSALKAWGSIVSSKARVDAILAAADVEFSGDELARYKRCMEDVKLLGGARNLIAHGTVYYRDGVDWISDDPRSEPRGPFILGPAPYNTSKMRGNAFYQFSVPQVQAIGMEIHKMWARVGALKDGAYHPFWRLSLR